MAFTGWSTPSISPRQDCRCCSPALAPLQPVIESDCLSGRGCVWACPPGGGFDAIMLKVCILSVFFMLSDHRTVFLERFWDLLVCLPRMLQESWNWTLQTWGRDFSKIQSFSNSRLKALCYANTSYRHSCFCFIFVSCFVTWLRWNCPPGKASCLNCQSAFLMKEIVSFQSHVIHAFDDNCFLSSSVALLLTAFVCSTFTLCVTGDCFF